MLELSRAVLIILRSSQVQKTHRGLANVLMLLVRPGLLFRLMQAPLGIQYRSAPLTYQDIQLLFGLTSRLTMRFLLAK